MSAKICVIEGCARPLVRYSRRGLCARHYNLYRVWGDPLIDRPEWIPNKGRTCSVEGCELDAKARGMCPSHYRRVKKQGDPQAHIPLRKTRYRKEDRTNPCATCEDVAWLKDSGAPEREIAERLGFSRVSTLREHLQRHSRTDLLER